MSSSQTLNAPSTLRFDGSSPDGQKEKRMKTLSYGLCGMTKMLALANNANMELGKQVYDYPPPDDGGCECCGKHILKPQSHVQTGCPSTEPRYVALLVKTWRPIYPRVKLDRIMGEWIHVRYEDVGTQQAAEMLLDIFSQNQVEEFFGLQALWLCAECASLDTDAYYEKFHSMFNKDDDDEC
jgi:hypothetical protein